MPGYESFFINMPSYKDIKSYQNDIWYHYNGNIIRETMILILTQTWYSQFILMKMIKPRKSDMRTRGKSIRDWEYQLSKRNCIGLLYCPVEYAKIQTSWASYQICNIAGCACAGKAGNVFPATDLERDRWLATLTCITIRAWRMCRTACRDR